MAGLPRMRLVIYREDTLTAGRGAVSTTGSACTTPPGLPHPPLAGHGAPLDDSAGRGRAGAAADPHHSAHTGCHHQAVRCLCHPASAAPFVAPGLLPPAASCRPSHRCMLPPTAPASLGAPSFCPACRDSSSSMRGTLKKRISDAISASASPSTNALKAAALAAVAGSLPASPQGGSPIATSVNGAAHHPMPPAQLPS